MDANKSLKIATRRFQNGNYLLSRDKFGQARKEFEVSLTLFERTDSYKEIAETLNNIGITLLRDGVDRQAHDFLERSYTMKKNNAVATKESIFNTLYNLLSIPDILTPDEFEEYFIELKLIGESLGGEYMDVVEKEKVIYDSMVQSRALEIERKKEEELARSSPEGALKHLQASGLPCVVRVSFDLDGFSLDIPIPLTYLNKGKTVRIESMSPTKDSNLKSTSGTIEFETLYTNVDNLINDIHDPMDNDLFDHIKKFTNALVLTRDDINFSPIKSNFTMTSVDVRNAFGEFIELYRANETRSETLNFTPEDIEAIKRTLSSKPPLYKLLMLNAKRLNNEGNFPISIIDAMTALNVFLNTLLRDSLTGDDLLSYTNSTEHSLSTQIEHLKRLTSDNHRKQSDNPTETYLSSTETNLSENNRDLEEALTSYNRIMHSENHTPTAKEADLVIETVDHAIHDLKHRYNM